MIEKELIAEARALKNKGYTNAAIAAQLQLKESTVRSLVKGA